MAKEKSVMLRDSKGHWLPGQQPPAMIRSSEQARSMAFRKRELAAAHARNTLARKAEAQGLAKSPIAAYGLLAGEAYDSALSNIMDKPKEAVEAGKFALRLADMLPAADQQAAMPSTGAALLLSDAAARGLTDALARLIERRADEG